MIRVFPTLQMLLFYFLFLHKYKDLSQQRELGIIQATLTKELESAEEQLAHLNEVQMQTAIHHHNMRHHLSTINSYLDSGQYLEASSYVKQIQKTVDSLAMTRYCENEIINLLCSRFVSEAEQLGIRMVVQVTLPKHLPFPDTELCALISNGLENSFNAVFDLKEPLKWVEVFSEIKLNKVLIEIRNPYIGNVIINNGLPVSSQPNHGYGTKSIKAIAERHHGLCSFEPDNGIFTLRIMLPLHQATSQQ